MPAGEAYRKQPSLDKARDAYRAYLDKVPTGEQSDRVRGELARVTSELEKQQAAARVAATAKPPDNHEELARSLEQVTREREQRETPARIALRQRGRVVLYAQPRYGGRRVPISS